MRNIFELIDQISKFRGMNRRQLAERSGLPIPTLSSLMTRQPALITRSKLQAIASALDADMHEVTDRPSYTTHSRTTADRILTALTEEEANMILERIGCDAMPVTAFLLPSEQLPYEHYGHAVSPEDQERNQYRHTIMMVMNRLNTDGMYQLLLNAMQIGENPAFRRSQCPSLNTRKTQSDASTSTDPSSEAPAPFNEPEHED